MSLPNHYGRNISANYDPRAPPSKVIKSSMGPYPGGVRNITDQYIRSPGINKTPGYRTNGSVRATVHSRRRDQNYVNVGQFFFIDTELMEKPILMNIQQLNRWLIEEGPKVLQNEAKHPWRIESDGTHNKMIREDESIDTGRKATRAGNVRRINQEENEKNYIINRFKLFGVSVNKDSDNSDEMPVERIGRATTATVRGVCHVLDYWSTATRRLRPYDQCYFVLKKVFITPETRIQDNLTISKHNTGRPMPASAWNKMHWQVVPYNNSDNTIDLDAYCWYETKYEGGRMVIDKTFQHVGYYWRLGNIHEYPDIGHYKMFGKRNDLSVAHDITYLHDNGAIIPIHFYLRFDELVK
jgi:hypothetical protein